MTHLTLSILSLLLKLICLNGKLLSYDEYNDDDSGIRRLGMNLTTIYFIGDLHADIDCARTWVERTRLVNFSSAPWTWAGSDSDAIVFLGDYVDKG